MLSLEDPRWPALHGGYRLPYDPRPALEALGVDWNDATAWRELWGELHHQGDVGEASYAAMIVIAALAEQVAARGWNVYALATTIEIERHARDNPPLPGWLAASYAEAWSALTQLAVDDLRTAADPLVVQSALAVLALARGSTRLCALIANLDDSEIDEYVEVHLRWSERFRPDAGPPTART